MGYGPQVAKSRTRLSDFTFTFTFTIRDRRQGPVKFFIIQQSHTKTQQWKKKKKKTEGQSLQREKLVTNKGLYII